jgi:hypothetical protein
MPALPSARDAFAAPAPFIKKSLVKKAVTPIKDNGLSQKR